MPSAIVCRPASARFQKWWSRHSYVIFECYDGYTTNLSLKELKENIQGDPWLEERHS